ncbi:Ig-like domain-containing protein [Actinoplanes couchii]|uniref:DUF11 domain-containing protein n=1 Tax=Actinoplanes couchii TaxID=403638 RepID=A0ABQ3XAJ7_9ACTN|nr:Ig-like domain-containing protein [Actinoplanes couchii]MDR6324889.1 hypothetical protein [Actinoplanes couchii]GID55489.1 hypothetical protein Aco03nite_038930 [Actinoplanes couchii]
MRTSPYRVFSAFVIMTLAVMAGVAVSAPEAEAAITNAFTSRYSANANGAILIRGNTNMQCPAATTNCTTAQSSATALSGEASNNNGYTMEYTNVDGDPATFNDSTANVDIPANSTVLFAGLYWGADLDAGGSGAAAPTPADNNKVLFKVPGSGSVLNTVTASTLYAPSTLTTHPYQAFADVTSAVGAAGAGVYTVANIQAGTGVDRYAGWSLVIAYQNAAKPLQSLHVYDGFGVVDTNTTSVDITVSGFQTPSDTSTDVQASIGAVVYEGDLGKVGDTLKLDNQSMSDAANPINNFFNSTVSEGGAIVSNRSPSYRNLMGVDLDQFDATGKLAHNATSTTLNLSTSGETIYPGVVTFTTALAAPSLTTVTTPTDVDGGDLLPGDIVEYAIDVTNSGFDTARDVTLTDAIPTNMTYIPGTMRVAGASVPDNGPPLVFSISSIPRTTTTRVVFRTRVNSNTAPNTSIVNVPNLSFYGSSSSSSQFNSTGDTSTVIVKQPQVNLTADLTVLPTRVNRSATPYTVNYTVKVDNAGADLEPHPIATVDLPTGVTGGTLPSNCVSGNANRRVTCDLTAIAKNSSGTVTFPASVANTAANTATATVTVTGTGAEGSPANNTDTADVTMNASPVAKTYDVTTTHHTEVTLDVAAEATDADNPTGPFTTSVTSAPAHGTTVVNADYSITYLPNTGWRGTDNFVFTCYDPYGGYDTKTATVTTTNAAPTAVADARTTGSGTPITIDVVANDTDPNNDTLTLTAVNPPQAGAGTTTRSGGKVVYTPAAGFKGTATFTYTISDGQSQNSTATGTVTVTVSDGPPVAVNDTATVAYAGTVLINVLANDSDPNNDPFGIEAGSVSTPSRGTARIVGQQIEYTAPAGFSGTATFTYRIKDNLGSPASTATVTVTVGNARPVPKDLTPSTGYETPVTLDPAKDSTDPNGDTLTVTATGTPGHGTVVRNNDGTLTYTPAPGFTGTDTFTYTISDGTDTATGTITITVSNAPPTAGNDTYTVNSNASNVLDVLANDSDPNNDPLTITIDTPPGHGTAQVVNGKIVYKPADGYHGTDTFHYTISDGKGGTAGATVSVTVVDVPPEAKPDTATTATNEPVSLNVLANDSDPNGDTLTLAAVTAPTHGKVTFTAAGVVTYTPDDGYYGIDTFTYTCLDPAGNSATGKITITVDNAAPNAIDDKFTVKPGTSTDLNVLTNDTDPNTGQVLTVLSVTPAAKGTVTLTGGKVTYTPNAGVTTGTDTFTYKLTDDLGATDEATVTVTISNGPTIQPDTATTGAGSPVDIDVTANDTDPDGGTLTLVSVTDPGHGTAVVAAGNKVRYTPNTGYYGSDTFTYTVRDSAGNTQTANVTVTVGNAPPVAVADTAAVKTGQPVDIDVLANDTDPNTDQALEISGVGTPGNGTAEIVDGKIRYTSEDGWTGDDTFPYEISDGAGGTAEGTVTVTVTADGKPVAVADERRTAYQKAITIKVLENDLDPDGTLALAAVGKPDHGTARASGDSVIYTPPSGFSGLATFTYSAKDAAGQTTGATVKVTVAAAPNAPDKAVEAEPGKAISIPLPTVDTNGTKITIRSIGKPKHGTAKLNANGTVTYKAAKGFAGTDTFTYQAVDPDGNPTSGTITVKVAGASQSPVAVKDRYTVKKGGTVSFKPLKNDTDPYGEKLTILKIGKPKHGTATLAGNTVTYAAPDGFTGTDTMTYTIQDERGGTARATITIRVSASGGGGDNGDLPTTGSNLTPVFTAGMLSMVIGGWLLMLTQVTTRPGRHRPGRHRI